MPSKHSDYFLYDTNYVFSFTSFLWYFFLNFTFNLLKCLEIKVNKFNCLIGLKNMFVMNALLYSYTQKLEINLNNFFFFSVTIDVMISFVLSVVIDISKRIIDSDFHKLMLIINTFLVLFFFIKIQHLWMKSNVKFLLKKKNINSYTSF